MDFCICFFRTKKSETTRSNILRLTANFLRVQRCKYFEPSNTLFSLPRFLKIFLGINHSLIIIMEVLILTLSIFKALKVCISWYSLATGLISEAMTYKHHIIQYSPCAPGSVQRNTSLGTVFPRTHPRESIGNTSSRGNIDNAPAMM